MLQTLLRDLEITENNFEFDWIPHRLHLIEKRQEQIEREKQNKVGGMSSMALRFAKSMTMKIAQIERAEEKKKEAEEMRKKAEEQARLAKEAKPVSEKSREGVQIAIVKQKIQVQGQVRDKIKAVIQKAEREALNLLDDDEMERIRLENESLAATQQ